MSAIESFRPDRQTRWRRLRLSVLGLLCCGDQEEHLNWLADQVGEPRLEAARLEMLEKAVRCAWSLDEGYRDRWEQEDNSATSAP